MANYTQLIKTINDNIKANGNQEITGPVLNAVLQAIVSGMSEGALFVGIANTTTNPPAYDGNVFYIAIEQGKYDNFGVDVPRGSIGVLHNMGGGNKWDVFPINTYYTIDVDTLMQDSPSSDDIDEAIGSFTYLRRAIRLGTPFFGRSASGDSTVAIVQVEQLGDNEVRVVMLNTGTIDGSNELVPIIKKITNSAGQLSLSTEAPTSFIGPLSSLNTNEKGSVVGAINEVNGLKSAFKPYVVDLTDLLAAQDSESISTAIGGIDNLNGTVQKNQVIFGILANGTVAVGIRVLGNQTTLTYFVDSVVGLTVNEIIITNTSGTLTKTANTHAVLTENMVINNLESDETTLPLSAAQGKILNKSIGQPIIEDIDLTTNAESGYFWNVNGTKTANSSWNISDSISLNKGDLLIINNVRGSTATSIITTISNTGDFIDSLVAADDTERNSYSYIADKDCKVQLSYSSITSAYIVKSSQNKAIVNTAFLHKIYEYYGAVYNAESGYWELNGLTDLTEDDMWDIYLWTSNLINQPSLDNAFSGSPIRTTFLPPIKSTYRTYKAGQGCSLNQVCSNCTSLEVFGINKRPDGQIALSGINAMHNAFSGCVKLRSIKPVLYLSVSSAYHATFFTCAFLRCILLSDVRIRGLRQTVSFQDSPLLSYDSLNYLVTNAANTKAITVTVHPTTYSYLTGTAQPTEEVGGTSEEWQALVTTAQGKQISFAQPAETLEVEPLE